LNSFSPTRRFGLIPKRVLNRNRRRNELPVAAINVAHAFTPETDTPLKRAGGEIGASMPRRVG
jgi:hypothetical protein